MAIAETQITTSPCHMAVSGPLSLVDVVREATGDNAFMCYQCVKCTSGCPMADQFDLSPHQIMRSVQLNDISVLDSKSIWLCVSCYTCATRCPQKIDVTGAIDALRIEARRRGVKPAVPEIAKFNEKFMRSIKIFGRAYELGLMASFNLALGRPFNDLKLGLRLLASRKLSLLPHFGRAKANAAKLPHNPKAIGYYPGCSLSSSAIEYGKSVRNIARALDIGIDRAQELELLRVRRGPLNRPEGRQCPADEHCRHGRTNGSRHRNLAVQRLLLASQACRAHGYPPGKGA